MVSPRLAKLVAFYETLRPETLHALDTVYAPSATFVDPFNDVQGVDAIRRIFAHMFEALDAPAFTVLEAYERDETAVLLWRFSFRLGSRSGQMLVSGMTRVEFGDDGRVRHHVDYWDAAGQLYERLPLIGAPLRWLRRRFAAPT